MKNLSYCFAVKEVTSSGGSTIISLSYLSYFSTNNKNISYIAIFASIRCIEGEQIKFSKLPSCLTSNKIQLQIDLFRREPLSCCAIVALCLKNLIQLEQAKLFSQFYYLVQTHSTSVFEQKLN